MFVGNFYFSKHLEISLLTSCFKTADRDIKGANILVDPTGEIKLADFGMAKHVSVALLCF